MTPLFFTYEMSIRKLQAPHRPILNMADMSSIQWANLAMLGAMPNTVVANIQLWVSMVVWVKKLRTFAAGDSLLLAASRKCTSTLKDLMTSQNR